jgi:DNA-binding SARP family transcriptional activator
MADPIRVTMLGSFSIRQGECQVDDSSNRMRKVWLLLAYLIWNRNDAANQAGYLSLFRGFSDGDDSTGRLKSLFYRARVLLDQLEDASGHQLILRKEGIYIWNTDVPLTLDAEEFRRLCTAARQTDDADRQLSLYLQALPLYRGDLLPKLTNEPWVTPLAQEFHGLYEEAAVAALPLLEDRGRWAEAESLCARALTICSDSEALYQHLMRCRIATDNKAGAIDAFEEMSQQLFDSKGTLPSEESRRLYREASREIVTHQIPMDVLQEQLKEPAGPRHAVVCEYDFFKLLYQVQARSIARTGEMIHIGLFSLSVEGRRSLPRRSLDLAVENLTEVAAANLRQGDVITRYSQAQLIIMLPMSDYENSCVVCQRIIRAFFRQYPHSPARIQFSVRPLEPHNPDAQEKEEDASCAEEA